jgi:CRP-like cAMP-binding protein
VEKLIVSEVFKNIKFSNEEEILIKSKFIRIALKKSNVLLRRGDEVDYQFFIGSGCFRSFFTENSGKEYNVQFAIKGGWISDYIAFFNSSTAIMDIDCIKDGYIYRISQEDMESLYIDIPELETFFRKKMEISICGFQKRILSNLALSAEQRYRAFLETYPTIEQIVKNYHIASYLGITTESLSRIRKGIEMK